MSIDEVAAAAGVTKGAVYHHFADKAALLEAVTVRIHRRTRQRVSRRVREAAVGAGRVGLELACLAYLDAIALPDAHCRLVFLEGPAVLGWSRWRRLDEDTWRQGLAAAIAASTEAEREEVDAITIALNAVLVDCALTVASDSSATGREAAAGTICAVLDVLVGSRHHRHSADI